MNRKKKNEIKTKTNQDNLYFELSIIFVIAASFPVLIVARIKIYK